MFHSRKYIEIKMFLLLDFFKYFEKEGVTWLFCTTLQKDLLNTLAISLSSVNVLPFSIKLMIFLCISLSENKDLTVLKNFLLSQIF